MPEEKRELERIQMEEDPLTRSAYPVTKLYPASSGYGYNYGAPDDGKLNFREMWLTVRKRKWLIAALVLIVTSIVTIELYRMKSIYRATATIEVRKDNTTLIKTADLVVQRDDSDSVNTFMYIIKSKPLLQDVAVGLKLDQNPRFLDVTRKKSIIEALGTIRGRFTQQAAPETPRPATVPALVTKSEVERSPEEAAQLAPYVGVLAKNINVEQLPNTRVLLLSFTHTDPLIAAEVTNGLANAFIDRTFQNKTRKFTKTSDWLDQTTRKLQAQALDAEMALANYIRQHNIISTEEKGSLATDKYLRLHEQALRAETDRTLKWSLLEEAKAGRVTQLPDAYANADTVELQKRLAQLERESSQLAVKYGPKNPRVVTVNEEITVLRNQIQSSYKTLAEKLEADYGRALRDEQALKNLLTKAKAEAAQQNQDSIQYGILKQDVDTAKGLYTEFLQKTHQADIQVAEQENNISLTEPAEVPVAPVGPQRMRAVLIAIFLSFAAGVALAFFLEYLDNTIKTVEDVSRYAQLPALSVIPSMREASAVGLLGKKGRKALPAGVGSNGTSMREDHSFLFKPQSSAAEAYRVLRTSVLLSHAGNPPRTVLITSGQPGEGKTTTAVNAAISLAQLGSSVLIIDGDLRCPSTHKHFGTDHSQGLSTYLSRDIELEPLIQKLQIPNLSILPSGAVPPNPAELISSEKMKQMVRQLAEKYDHVLIDSPPLMNVTDPVILSTLVDGVILVVHGGKSSRQIVQRTRRELASVGARIFGVVLNNVDIRRGDYGDYYYYNRYYSRYEEDNAGTSA
jgi:capsular exopolysaccharide synthesis family protein